MKKKVTLSQSKKKAWKVFSQYIRTRDCIETTGRATTGRCFTCASLRPYNALQAGHFLQGRHNATLFIETNCHAQCVGCNMFKHGNLVEYTRKMIAKYGMKNVDMLREMNNQIEKRTVSDYQELEKFFKDKLEDLYLTL